MKLTGTVITFTVDISKLNDYSACKSDDSTCKFWSAFTVNITAIKLTITKGGLKSDIPDFVWPGVGVGIG